MAVAVAVAHAAASEGDVATTLNVVTTEGEEPDECPTADEQVSILGFFASGSGCGAEVEVLCITCETMFQ